MASPALAALAARREQFNLTLLAMFPSVTEYLRDQGFTDDVRLISFLGMSKRRIFAHALRLRREQFDASVIPYAMNRLGYNVLARVIAARQRIGFRYQRQCRINLPQLNQCVLDEDPSLHVVEENLRWAKLLLGDTNTALPDNLCYRVSADARRTADEFLRQQLLADASLLIGVHAGCNSLKNQHHRLWPSASFARLIGRLLETRSHARVLLFQGPQDIEINQVILSQLGDYRRDVVLVDRLPMRAVAVLIQRCRIFISNDSGLMHTAAACRVPCVAVFGPTNPNWVRPWKTHCAVVSRRLLCSPCFYYSSRPLRCVAGIDYACVRGMTLDEVLAPVQSLLAEADAKSITNPR